MQLHKVVIRMLTACLWKVFFRSLSCSQITTFFEIKTFVIQDLSTELPRNYHPFGCYPFRKPGTNSKGMICLKSLVLKSVVCYEVLSKRLWTTDFSSLVACCSLRSICQSLRLKIFQKMRCAGFANGKVFYIAVLVLLSLETVTWKAIKAEALINKTLQPPQNLVLLISLRTFDATERLTIQGRIN